MRTASSTSPRSKALAGNVERVHSFADPLRIAARQATAVTTSAPHRELSIAGPAPLTVGLRQVAGRVVVVEVDLHAALVGSAGLLQIAGALRRGFRGVGQPFLVSAEQAQALRRLAAVGNN